MARSDNTSEFKELVVQLSSQIGKPRKSRAQRQGREDGEGSRQAHLSKEFLKEAYSILSHINDLTRMLSSIRKPYLNVDSDSTYSRQAGRSFTMEGTSSGSPWANFRTLSNEERDQIDLQARVILTKCADRVKAMEALEQRRKEMSSREGNILLKFLPSLRQDLDSLASASLAAHHSGVTYYLNRKLAEASETQKEMQEERVRRYTERTRSLGSYAAREARELTLGAPSSNPPSQSETSSRSWLGGASSSIASSFTAAIGGSSGTQTPSASQTWDQVQKPNVYDFEEDDDDDLVELSSSQIQQFEEENAIILQSAQDTLESVRQAEARLLDISALQMELVAHLTKQTEITEQLYEDAIAASAQVDKGNIQLKEAKRRAKDSRLYLLIFFILASFSLLFLHYY